jgi:hypothetical protein
MALTPRRSRTRIARDELFATEYLPTTIIEKNELFLLQRTFTLEAFVGGTREAPILGSYRWSPGRQAGGTRGPVGPYGTRPAGLSP